MSNASSKVQGEGLFQDIWTDEEVKEAMSLRGPILIIGASGFIGSKLFFSLAQRRKDVIGTCRQRDANWRLLRLPDGVKDDAIIPLDITDYESVKMTLNRYRPMTVFNLSAYGAYERQADALRIQNVNYIGTHNLLSILFEQGCEAYVQAGSSSEYGLNCAGPDEEAPLVPNSEYAVSKAAAAHLIKYYGVIKSFPAVNLRLYSIYGPWEERDRLIPNVIKNGIAGKYPPFADRNISRDFVYVDDCTRAFVRAATVGVKEARGSSINIASGVKTSLGDVASAMKRIFGIADEPQFGSMQNRKWDLSNWFGKPTLVNTVMKWHSRTSFEEGLRLSRDWEVQASEVLRFGVPTKSSKKISMVVACYRDHEAIPVMHQRVTEVFESLPYDYELIFVNDCSPTEDEEMIRKICHVDPRVIGVSHSRNFGSQSAFLSGMEIASGNGVVLMDGDLQDPPEIIPALIKKWEEGFDVAYGERVQREAPLYMQILYKIFYRIFKRMSEVRIPVDAGDFSLMDRKVVDYLIEFPEKDVFLRGLRAWVGFKQAGVPYVRPKRPFGITTNSFLKNIWWAKKAIFSFSIKPLEYIQRLGIIVFIFSGLLGILYTYFYFTRPIEVRGFFTTVVLILGLGGVQLISLSVLGDYLGKVLEEVKDRPQYIRARIFKGATKYETRPEIDKFVTRSSGRTIAKV